MPKVRNKSKIEAMTREEIVQWNKIEALCGIQSNMRKAVILIEHMQQDGIEKHRLELLAEALMIDIKILRMEFPQTREAMLKAWKKYTD